ncbi:uncharacterized protein LOC130736969 [Lotus japonicus]|uniref:uncharacterized protein LOC130736969 n=1 Tax=Lotus japonicus TaxID=34305 RepID=UPI00258A98C8|nr:uncharacterized protein LOC130736969 [Lotus japonicus]
MMSSHAVASNIAGVDNDLRRYFGEPFSAPQASPRLVRWLPRVGDNLVVNVDGNVWDITRGGGFTGGFRSSFSRRFGRFYGFQDDPNILHLELLAIYYGLSSAWDRGARTVKCQSDSLDAVTLVNSSPSSSKHIYASLI